MIQRRSATELNLPPSDLPSTLSHYTRSIDSVVGILTNGFAWAPRARKLMGLFPKRARKRLPFGSKEPEQFGMVCFSAAKDPHAQRMRRLFGAFEIRVPAEWVWSRGGRPVTYLRPWSIEFVRRRLASERALTAFESSLAYPDDTFFHVAYGYEGAARALGTTEWGCAPHRHTSRGAA